MTVHAHTCQCGPEFEALVRGRICARCGGHRGGVLARDPEAHGPGSSEVGGRGQGATGVDRVEWLRTPERDHARLLKAAVAARDHLDHARAAQALAVLDEILVELGGSEDAPHAEMNPEGRALFDLGLSMQRAVGGER